MVGPKAVSGSSPTFLLAPTLAPQHRLAEYRLLGSLLAPLGLMAAILLITVLYRHSRSDAARDEGHSRSTVARVIELSVVSDQSFEDAVNMAVKRATSTLRNVEIAWVKDQNVLIENGNTTGYKVNLAITFVLEEGEQPA